MKKVFSLLLLFTCFQVSAQWITQATGFSASSRGIQDMDAVNSSILWAVAYDGTGSTVPCQDFTRTTDGGTTWIPGTISGITNLGLGMIEALDAQTAWVVAYPPSSSVANQGIWKTTNGGITWTRQSSASFSGPESFVNTVHFFNANEGWCAGDPIYGEFEIYTTTNGGATWSLVPGSQIANPVNGEFGVIGYACSVGDTSWFGTNKGRIYRSVDKGHNWTVSQIPGWNFTYCTPVFKDGMHGLAQDRSTSSTGALAETSDGGVTWTVIPGVTTFYTDLNYVPGTANTYVADGGEIDYSGCKYSLDGGHTWTLMPETDGVQYLHGVWVDPQHGWAGGFNTDAYTGGMFKYIGNLGGSYVTVMSPNGGEYLQTGTNYNITWAQAGITNVKIEYSVNNGTSWSTIVYSYPANTGSYTWTVPNNPSGQCKVRISDAANSSMNDISDDVFTIGTTTQFVTLTSPNGGENWQAGTNHNITWTSSAISTVTIEYSVDGGSYWNTIASSIPASNGLFTWSVPYTPSSYCLVKIMDSGNPLVSDMSDNMFTISPSTVSLNVVAPDGGETWIVGNSYNILWASSGITNVKIEYTVNDGISWSTIISNYNATNGSYLWLIPNTPSSQCRIRISEVGNPSVYDISDGAFTIAAGIQSVTVNNPNGGECWVTGSVQNITWSSMGIVNVQLEYSINNGAAWSTIIYSFPASAGGYSWFVPNTPSSQCRIRISSLENPSVSDISDAVFTISAGGQSTPEICIVTVDSIYNKNKIVWEKEVSSTISHYNVYSEGNQANVYNLIGTVPYANLSVFTDMNSNPLQQANKYKISVVDISNIETALSDAHMTVHLTINQGAGNTWNLIWNDYEGFDYPSINIYRGTSLSGMSILATISSSLNSFTDLYPPAGYVYYKIEVVKPVPCSPSKTTIASSVSNIASNDPYLSIGEELENMAGLKIYPNPTSGKITVHSLENIDNITVVNSLGTEMLKETENSSMIDLDISGFSAGVYFLKIDRAGKVIIRKVVKTGF